MDLLSSGTYREALLAAETGDVLDAKTDFDGGRGIFPGSWPGISALG